MPPTDTPTDDTDTDDTDTSGPLDFSRRHALQGLVALTTLGSAAAGVAFGSRAPPLVVQETTISADDEPNGTRSNASPLPVNETTSGKIWRNGVDWFAVDLTAGTDYEITLTRSTAGTIAVVLYDVGGSFIDTVALGEAQTATLPFTAAETATHYLQVVNLHNAGGRYTLGVATATTPTPTPTETPTATPTATPTSTPTATPIPDDGQAAYGGTTRALSGRLQAEAFDTGGEGVAFHDTSDENAGGALRDTKVDIEPAGDGDGEYNVGWVTDGEWLEYTVDAASGTYDVNARVATPSGGATIRILLDGAELGTLDVPETGDWQSYTTITLSGVDVAADGESVLRVEFAQGDSGRQYLCNLNWLSFVSTDTAPVSGYGTGAYGAGAYGHSAT